MGGAKQGELKETGNKQNQSTQENLKKQENSEKLRKTGELEDPWRTQKNLKN